VQQLTYLDFELEIQHAGDGYVARIIHSPAGEATQIFSVPFSQDKLENLILKLGSVRSGTRKIQSIELEAARELGGKLFDAVFSGDLRACFMSSRDQALEAEGRGLRIKLRLQEVPELADIPWEYLFDSSTDRFFAQSNQTPIVRYLAIREKVPSLAVTFPLRILVMVSRPSDYACLDVEREKSKIKEALKDLAEAGKIQLEFLESATLTALVHRLRKQDCHVFHYIGHGGFDKQSEEGVLVLEDDRGRSWLAGAHRVGTVLHDCRSLRLAVFNACEGARNSQTDPFTGLAATVVHQGIPAVVGMQFEITDQAAIIFSREFYGAIAEGFPVDAALAEARKAIYLAPNDVEWGTPVLYMRSPDGILFELSKTPATEIAHPPGEKPESSEPRPAEPPRHEPTLPKPEPLNARLDEPGAIKPESHEPEALQPKRKSKGKELPTASAAKVEEKQPLGVGAKVAVALAAVQVVSLFGYITSAWDLFRIGHTSVLEPLLVTLSGAILPLIGGVLVVLKFRAATYVFGMAVLCDVFILIVGPPIMIIGAALSGCACILSARQFRPRR
jgi:hypothetical protein